MVRSLALLALAGCAGLTLPLATTPTTPAAPMPAPGRPALTVVLARTLPRARETRAAIDKALGKSFALVYAEPPSAPPEPPSHAAVEQELAAVRKSYINADFGPCLERVGELQRAGDLLAEGERLLGERLLFWRVACLVGAGRTADARRAATVFATFGMTAPPDVEAAAPDVEGLLADALRAVAAAPRHPLRVTAVAAAGAGRLAPHAVVSVDGRPGVCVAPCAVDLPDGDHAVRVEADGFAPETRLTRVDETSGSLALTLAPADPELAARQWTARHAGAPALDTTASVALLAQALRSPSLAVVAVEPAARGTRLTGALAQGGGIGGRAERVAASEADVPDAAVALLRDLLLRGRLLEPAPPLYARPLFWVGVGAAAVAATAVTFLLLYEPEKQIKVGF